MQHWEVGQQESGIKLVAFLKSKLENISLRQLKKSIEANRCQINGRTERFASAMLGVGDHVAFLVGDLERQKPQSAAAILYQDDDFIMIHKPAGVASDSANLLTQVQRYVHGAELLHRLDRDTTGVLMYACHPKAREAMIHLFRCHEVSKSYLALVDGRPEKQKGVVDNYLAKKRTYEGQALWGSHPAGLHAVTEWHLEKRGEAASLLSCYPKTGRTHQIRVHLSEMGHPILGDYQYGRVFGCSYRPQRYLLHAWKIAFQHPYKHSKVDVEAPIPSDFEKAMSELLGGWQ